MTQADTYPDDLRALQIGLVRYQTWAIKTGAKALIILEGRDGAGKDGAIARITEYLAPRRTRNVSLPKPSDRERGQWYFQRYVENLPTAGELVLFNRSWYNRAGVEPVMGFCTPAERDAFMQQAPVLEAMLERDGVRLVKLWLDISKGEQAKRLQSRRDDPLKALKISDLDGEAQRRWSDYSKARDLMLLRTHTLSAPWFCVRGDHKKPARLNVIRHLLHVLAPEEVRAGVDKPDPDVLFVFEPSALQDGRLAA
jgi:polyphosphate kinase 2